ncbi:MAG: methyltransferase domain-containing protein [Acidobacteria bacterium]|nr:methyltransferase domain-containing protein [Acidobacteriota bacterium]
MSATHGVLPSLVSGPLRRLLRRVLGQEEALSPPVAVTTTVPLPRRSNGLREFWRGLQDQPGLHILDLGAASQANISFITDRGHKFYTADLLSVVSSAPLHGKMDGEAEEAESRFWAKHLNYPGEQFDGILGWDVLDFVGDPLVKPLVERLYEMLKPGGNLLFFFHTNPAGQPIPLCQYRICSEDKLEIIRRGMGKFHRQFQNRSIENLFRKFSSLKFYLSRDNLREVVIVR